MCAVRTPVLLGDYASYSPWLSSLEAKLEHILTGDGALQGICSALRRCAFCCEEVLFCWPGWDGEGLLCTCRTQHETMPGLQHSLLTLSSVTSEGDPTFLLCLLCCESPVGLPLLAQQFRFPVSFFYPSSYVSLFLFSCLHSFFW